MIYPDGDSVGSQSSPLTYDAAGRPTAIPGIVTSTIYDARGQLLQQMNANGTVTTKTYDASRVFFWLSGTTTSLGSTQIRTWPTGTTQRGRSRR